MFFVALYLHILYIFQAVLRHSLSVGEDLGQAGYQAVASCCLRHDDGLQLLAEMKVYCVVYMCNTSIHVHINYIYAVCTY